MSFRHGADDGDPTDLTQTGFAYIVAQHSGVTLADVAADTSSEWWRLCLVSTLCVCVCVCVCV